MHVRLELATMYIDGHDQDQGVKFRSINLFRGISS